MTYQVIQKSEQQKWLAKLLGYDFEILYGPSKHNLAADALSRVLDASLLAISSREFTFVQDLRTENKTHSELQAYQKRLLHTLESIPGFEFKEGLLFFKGQLVIPSDSSLCQ